MLIDLFAMESKNDNVFTIKLEKLKNAFCLRNNFAST